MVLNNIRFYGEELLALRPNLKLKDHPLSAVCDWLFNIFATISNIGYRSSIRNLRTLLAAVTRTHLSRLSSPFSNSYLDLRIAFDGP